MSNLTQDRNESIKELIKKVYEGSDNYRNKIIALINTRKKNHDNKEIQDLCNFYLDKLYDQKYNDLKNKKVDKSNTLKEDIRWWIYGKGEVDALYDELVKSDELATKANNLFTEISGVDTYKAGAIHKTYNTLPDNVKSKIINAWKDLLKSHQKDSNIVEERNKEFLGNDSVVMESVGTKKHFSVYEVIAERDYTEDDLKDDELSLKLETDSFDEALDKLEDLQLAGYDGIIKDNEVDGFITEQEIDNFKMSKRFYDDNYINITDDFIDNEEDEDGYDEIDSDRHKYKVECSLIKPNFTRTFYTNYLNEVKDEIKESKTNTNIDNIKVYAKKGTLVYSITRKNNRWKTIINDLDNIEESLVESRADIYDKDLNEAESLKARIAREAQEDILNDTEDGKRFIKNWVRSSFETGHGYAEDYEEFSDWLRDEGIEPSEELYDYYIELLDYGPTGFYQEFKDELDFDSDFVREFGIEEDYKNMDKTIEEKLKYIKEYPTYYSDGTRYFTRPCKVWDLGLTDEQKEKFYKFIGEDGGLNNFWFDNEELSNNIYQAGRMGGHLILDDENAMPSDYTEFDSFEDIVQAERDTYRYYSDEPLEDWEEKEAKETAEQKVNLTYNTLVDFDNRVDKLIDNLKIELDGYVDPNEDTFEEGWSSIYHDIEDEYFQALKQAEESGAVTFSVIPYGLEAREFDTFEEAKEYAKENNVDKIHVSSFSIAYGYYDEGDYDEYDEQILDLDGDIITDDLEDDLYEALKESDMEDKKYNSLKVDYYSNAYYPTYFNFKEPITTKTIKEIKSKIGYDFYIVDIAKEYNGTIVKKKDLIEPTAIIKIYTNGELEESSKRKKGRYLYMNPDSGDVEHNVEFFNNATNVGNVADAGQAMGENINIKESLIKLDNDNYKGYYDMYINANLNLEEKKELANLLVDNKINESYNYLLKKQK